MTYRPWFERYQTRFADERKEMERRGFVLDEEAFKRHNRVEFVGKSRRDPKIELRVTFSDSFPSNAPHVLTKSVRLKRHHRPDTGEICTFGPSRARWLACLPGSAAIDEAEDVIMAASGSQTGEQEYLDDVPEPASALYHYQNTFVLIPPAIAAFAAAMPEGSSARFALRFDNWPGQEKTRNGPGRGVVTEVRDRSQAKAQAESCYEKLVQREFDIPGKVVRLAKAPPLTTEVSELNSWLGGVGHERTDWMAFVFPEQSGNAATQRLAWLLVRFRPRLEYIRTFVMDDGGRAARIPGLSSLADKTIVCVGCGSLGSKIAASLTATGINHFGLVDFDFLEPDNALRHESGVNLFGFPKVMALRDRLFELNPQTLGTTRMLQMVIGGFNDAVLEKELQDLIGRASLVIDTTGNHGVSRHLNDICADLNVPQLYASVTNGAWGGEVVRVIPGRTACWMCWLVQYESSRPSAEPSPDVGVFAPGCDQPTFTGTSYDLGIVAGLACSLAVDTLLIEEPGRKHYEGDYIRWQLRNSEGKFLPITEVLPTQKRKPCPFCNPN